MTPPMPPVQIHVLDGDDKDDDVGLADVGVVTVDGERHLFLNPQSFGSAVRQVSSALPDLTLEQVERLVREHCKELQDFDELLSPVDPAQPVDASPPPVTAQAGRPKRRMKRWAAAAGLLAALVGSWALGHYTNPSPALRAESGASDGSSTSEAPNTADRSSSDIRTRPFSDPMFLGFTEGNFDCRAVNDFEAECTDADGVVMSTKAAVAPDSTIYTFSYGSERLGLQIFSNRDYAETWARQDGTTELYPHLSRIGRYVLWGTDEGRLKKYQGLLKNSPENVAAVQIAGDTRARRAVLRSDQDAVRPGRFTA